MGLQIGYKASAEQFGPRELVELGVLAEQVGLDSVMVSDHLQPWRHVGGHGPASRCPASPRSASAPSASCWARAC